VIVLFILFLFLCGDTRQRGTDDDALYDEGD